MSSLTYILNAFPVLSVLLLQFRYHICLCPTCQTTGYERLAGDIVFYPAAEPHPNLQTLPGSKIISFEFEPSFFKKNEIKKSAIGKAVHKIPATKFLLLKVYRELMSGDPYSGESISMLLLHLMQGPDRFYNKGPKNKSFPDR